MSELIERLLIKQSMVRKTEIKPLLVSASRLMILFLALFLLTVLSAEACQAESLVTSEDLSKRFDPPPQEIVSMVAMNGVLVFNDLHSVYTIDVTGGAATYSLDSLMGTQDSSTPRIVTLVPGQSSTALVDTQSGRMIPLSMSNGMVEAEPSIQLNWSDYITDRGGDHQVDPPIGYTLLKDTLYVLDRAGTPIARFDLDTGQKLTSLAVKAANLLPYKDDRLLLVSDVRKQEDDPTALVIQVYDPRTDLVQTVWPIKMDHLTRPALRGASYEPSTDTLLLALDDVAYAYPGLGVGQPCALLPKSGFSGGNLSIVAMPNHLLAAASGEHVFLKSAMPSEFAGRTELKMLVSVSNTAGLNQAANAVDGVTLNIQQLDLNALEFAQLLISGHTEYDLFWIDLKNVDFEALMKKGYALGLSENEHIKEFHSRLYPFLQEAVAYDGVIYALPVTALSTVMLGEDNLTFDNNGKATLHSFNDFLDFMETWSVTYGVEYPDMVPYGGSEVKRGIFDLALRTYINSYIGTEEAVDFDTPLMRRIFRRLESFDWDAFEQGNEKSGYSAPAVFGDEWMTDLRLFNGEDRDSNRYFPLLLSAEEGQPGRLPLEVTCVFINARTKKAQAALHFLETLKDNVEDNSRIMMLVDDNVPVENPRYEQTIADYKSLLDQQRQKLEISSSAERLELEAWIKNAEKHLEEMKETERWFISERNIKAFREMAANAFVLRFNGEYQGAQAALDILRQYSDRSVDLERFIIDIQSRLNLVRLENQ